MSAAPRRILVRACMHVYAVGPIRSLHVYIIKEPKNTGLPIAINDRGEWTTPSPKAYAEVDAAVAFGKGYDKYWVRRQSESRFGFGCLGMQ